jgi:DNA-binding MarR family transcriptional regulator
MKTDELYIMANEIRILAALVTKMARRDLQGRLGSSGTGVSELQYGIMRLLSYQEHTISELSCKFMLDPSTLVPAVDALERKKLARRGRDPGDRRRNPLSLTERGAEFVARVPVMDGQDSLVKSLNTLGDEQCHQLLMLLRELVRRMAGGEDVLHHVSSRVRPQTEREEFSAGETDPGEFASAEAGVE